MQGVGYRYGMKLSAARSEVAGWVRNRDDGAVEAEVEAAPDRVDEMMAWVSHGPPGARVDAVEITEIRATGQTGFEVHESA